MLLLLASPSVCSYLAVMFCRYATKKLSELLLENDSQSSVQLNNAVV